MASARQVVVGSIAADVNLVCGFDMLADDAHKVDERFHFCLRKIFGKLSSGCHQPNLLQQLVTEDKLDPVVALQVNQPGKSAAYKEAYPAVGADDAPQLSRSLHGVCVLRLSLQPLCRLRRSRWYGKCQGNGSAPDARLGGSALLLSSAVTGRASAEAAATFGCN